LITLYLDVDTCSLKETLLEFINIQKATSRKVLELKKSDTVSDIAFSSQVVTFHKISSGDFA